MIDRCLDPRPPAQLFFARMPHDEKRQFAAAVFLTVFSAVVVTQACGKQALPPGCTEADFAALAMICPSEDECNRLNEEKRARCVKKVEAE